MSAEFPAHTPLTNCTVEICRQGAEVTVAFRGDLDLADVEEVTALLDGAAALGSRLVVRLDELEFVDSAGLSALMAASAICEQSGVALELVNAGHSVRRLFDLTGVTPLLRLTERSARSDPQGVDELGGGRSW